MTTDVFLRYSALIIATGGIALALHLLWRHTIHPMYRFVIALSAFMEAQPVLLDIAAEFRPNDGATLRDQVDTTNMRLSNIEGQMEQLVQHLGDWNGNERRTL